MPDVHDQEIIARKLFPLIYIFDTSGSMKGAKITAANSAMRETMEVLKDVSKNNPSAELKIGVLQFASGAKWRQPAQRRLQWSHTCTSIMGFAAILVRREAKLSTYGVLSMSSSTTSRA